MILECDKKRNEKSSLYESDKTEQCIRQHDSYLRDNIQSETHGHISMHTYCCTFDRDVLADGGELLRRSNSRGGGGGGFVRID